MKTFTQRAFIDKNFAQSEDYNDEAWAIGAAFNGNLSGEQLPYASVSDPSFSLGDNLDAQVRTTPAGAVNGVCQRKPTQLYAVTQTDISNFTGFSFPGKDAAWSGILGPPSSTYNTNSSAWGPGWNRFSDQVADGVYLSLPLYGGKLKGCALVDFEFYYGDNDSYGVGSGITGGQWRWRVGVFVDSALVAVSGKLPPRRHSLCLPFAIDAPARRVTVDVRWSANYDGAGSTNNYTYTADTALRSYNHTLWVRNQYR